MVGQLVVVKQLIMGVIHYSNSGTLDVVGVAVEVVI